MLMDDPDLFSDHLRADAGINNLRGVGVSEAPRGTLFHDYTVDRNGVHPGGQHDHRHRPEQPGDEPLGAARSPSNYITGQEIPEGVLNRVEHGIRNFDPCLSCSTHAVGKMPMQVKLIGAGGDVLDEVTRG